MFLLRKPSPSTIELFLSQQPNSTFSYPEIGATAGALPHSYNVDRNRVVLGSGPRTFRKAVEYLRAWQMFKLGWVDVSPHAAPIRVGENVAVLVRHFGFWSLNAAQIVYVLEEERRFGFAYGTLQDHAEQGEERFSIDWSEDDSVAYNILAFSKPNQWQVKLMPPFARGLQKKFARDSLAAMKRAIDGLDVRRPS
jgi:uncharacterized protein (UPF0548 family)